MMDLLLKLAVETHIRRNTEARKRSQTMFDRTWANQGTVLGILWMRSLEKTKYDFELSSAKRC